jgi:hypothetical protein
MNLDITQADQSEVESKKNWTPLILVVIIAAIFISNYSVSLHDQSQESNRYLVCFTKNNTDRWEGKCFPIWLHISDYWN